MKNFLLSVFVFCMLALCNGAIAGDLTDSAEYRAFHWIHSEPVTAEFTINHPGNNSGNANTREIMRRLVANGWNSFYADTVLFSGFAELYECPYMEYGQTLEDFFPRQWNIELMRDFSGTEYEYSRQIVQALRVSGLQANEAQSLYYNGLDEYLACVLED